LKLLYLNELVQAYHFQEEQLLSEVVGLWLQTI